MSKTSRQYLRLYVNHKVCNIDLQVSMIILESINTPKSTKLVTISDKNCWDSLCFHKKSLKIVSLARRYRKLLLSLVQCCAKPRKAVPGSMASTEHGSLQPTLNKYEEGASRTIFITDFPLSYKISEKSFLKIQKIYFEKALREEYIIMFVRWFWGVVVHLPPKILQIRNRKI